MRCANGNDPSIMPIATAENIQPSSPAVIPRFIIKSSKLRLSDGVLTIIN